MWENLTKWNDLVCEYFNINTEHLRSTKLSQNSWDKERNTFVWTQTQKFCSGNSCVQAFINTFNPLCSIILLLYIVGLTVELVKKWASNKNLQFNLKWFWFWEPNHDDLGQVWTIIICRTIFVPENWTEAELLELQKLVCDNFIFVQFS